MAGRAEPSWAVRISFFAVPLALVALFFGVREQPAPAHRVVATLGGRAWDLVVADTEPLRERGLQGAPEPGRGAGMLFVFDRPQQVTMIIKSLPYAVDVAFIGEELRVVRTVSIQPTPLGIQAAPSGVPVLFAVETKAGSLAAGSIGIGSSFGVLREER